MRRYLPILLSGACLLLPGQAVELSRGPGNAFFSGPLTLPRGVTLFLDRSVILVASRRRSDYDLAPGSCRKLSAAACKPLLLSYQAAYSAILGNGVIDGRDSVPDLVEENESNDFTLAGITLRNPTHAAAFIIKGTGLTVWGVTGLDLLSDKDVTLRDASIQTSGAGIRIASDPTIFPSSAITLANNRMPAGHGLIIDPAASGVRRVTMLKLSDPPLAALRGRGLPALQLAGPDRSGRMAGVAARRPTQPANVVLRRV